MAILNYTTTVAVTKTIGEIHARLVEAGARSIQTHYDGGGHPQAVIFAMETNYGPRTFSLPADTTRVLAVMRKDRVPPRYQTPEQAERVAWRILKDWLEAQLALIRVDMAALDQVMLPYMTDPETGRTVYEVYRDRQLALPTGDTR